jgi:hypothetical protein
MYQQAQEQASGAGTNGAADGDAGGSSEDEDVVDAEVVDEPKV